MMSRSPWASLVAQQVMNLPAIPETACIAGDADSIPGSGRSPGGGNSNPLQYSCLGNPRIEKPGGLQSMGVTELDTTYRLNHHPQDPIQCIVLQLSKHKFIISAELILTIALGDGQSRPCVHFTGTLTCPKTSEGDLSP